jgi:hypothetical protein
MSSALRNVESLTDVVERRGRPAPALGRAEAFGGKEAVELRVPGKNRLLDLLSLLV